jgi:hypothetical protein
MDHLVLSHGELSILSEHFNLTYIYNPLSVDPTFASHVEHKFQRWAFKISMLLPHGARDERAQPLDRVSRQDKE